MKLKTSELSEKQLDYAVCVSEGFSINGRIIKEFPPPYSSLWQVGGPIIEREKITVCWEGTTWVGSLYLDHDRRWGGNKVGSTPLIAAMRCYVASKLGDEVEFQRNLYE